MKFAKLVLFITNTLLFLLGSGAAAVCLYVLQFNSDFSDVVPVYMTQIALFTAIAVVVVALLACIAAANYHKGWAKMILLCYSFLLFIVLAIEVGAGILVYLKRAELTACETNDFGTALCPDAQHVLRHFTNTTMELCCPQSKRADPACSWAASVLTDTTCASPTSFRSALFRHINEKLQPVAIFVIVVCAIELVTIIATCYLMTQHDDNMVVPQGGRGTDSLPSKAGELPTKSRAVLLVVNFVLLVLGSAMAGFAAYILNFNTSVTDVISSGAPALVLATGVVIVILSLLGCIGACNWSKGWAKCLLVVYDLVLLIIILVEVLAAIMLALSISNLASCRDSPLGSSECEDSKQVVLTFINNTRTDCCFPVSRRSEPDCAWAKTVLTDSTCANFDTFKGALLDYVETQMVPICVIVVIIAIIQLITFCSTCCLIKAKGKAVLSGKAHHIITKSTPSFYYGATVELPQRHAAPSAAGNWATATDGQGRVYYYHKVTRETRWDPPPELVV